VRRAISTWEPWHNRSHSGDEFHAQALRTYLSRFEFADDSLDVAVRRLLMDVGLPRETQQIDRVMEAFAGRYYQDHPDLFISEGVCLPSRISPHAEIAWQTTHTYLPSA
jgi:Sec7-like guanine-nucleotide exchange factor